MHKNIEEIKKLEGSPKIIKNLFNKNELERFLKLYQDLPTTVHNKKQNVIKKRCLKNYSSELESLFYNKVKNEIDCSSKNKTHDILVLGYTFKENCSDIRNTKVSDIVSGLRKINCNVDIYDPLLKMDNIMTKNPISVEKETLASKSLSIMSDKKITSLCVHKNKNKKKTIGLLHIHNILSADIQ